MSEESLSLSERLEAAEAKLREKDGLIKQIRSKTKAFVAELKESKAKLQAERDAAIQQRKEDIAEVTASAKAKITALREERSALESRLAAVEVAKDESTRKEAVIEEVSEQLRVIRTEKAELEVELKEREQAVLRVEEEKKESDAMVNASAKQKEELLQQLSTLQAQNEDLNTEMGRMKLQHKTLKDLLRDQTQEHEETKQRMHEFELKAEEVDQAKDAARISAAAEVEMKGRMNDALAQLEEQRQRHENEMQRAEANLIDAVASKNELEASLESLKADLEMASSDALSKKRTAVAYIDSLKAEIDEYKTGKEGLETQLSTIRAELNSNTQARIDVEKELNEVRERLVAKDEEIVQINTEAERLVQAAKREAEEVKSTRIKMDATVESKVEETEQHKRLRQLAKSETLALARKLEESSKLSDTVMAAVESTLLPRVTKIGSILQELEWKVDAALSAISMRKGENNVSGDSSRPTRTPSTNLKPEESAAALEKTLHYVEHIKQSFDGFISEMKRVLDKTVRLSEYALEETTVLGAASKSLRRAIGDCMTASSRDRNNVVFEPLSRHPSTASDEHKPDGI